MRLVALKRVYYPAGNGVEYEPGQSFETVTDKDAEVLVAVGVAEHPKKAQVSRKSMAAQSAPAPESAKTPDVAAKPAPDLLTTTSAAPLSGGAYNRRDMQAKD